MCACYNIVLCSFHEMDFFSEFFDVGGREKSWLGKEVQTDGILKFSSLLFGSFDFLGKVASTA